METSRMERCARASFVERPVRNRARRQPKPEHRRVQVEGEWLRCHKATGQAYLILANAAGRKQRKYVGRFEVDGAMCAATVNAARRIVLEHRAHGGGRVEDGRELSVRALCDAFLAHVRVDQGEGRELTHYRRALAPVVKVYGRQPAAEFRPQCLKAIRDRMARETRDDGESRRCRWTINSYLRRIRTCFCWGVEQGFVHTTVADGLKHVKGLVRGRASSKDVREGEKVAPVPVEHVDAVLPFLSRQLQAVVLVQRWTSARPSEVLRMTPAQVDRAGRFWTFRPTEHKGRWRDLDLRYPIPRRLEEVLLPFLENRLPSTPCFSPREAEQERRAALNVERVERERARRELERQLGLLLTPMMQGNRPGTNRSDAPERAPREHYDVATYGRAIRRACEKAGVPAWHPHQLRHLRLTEVDEQHGPEAARVTAGHRDLGATRNYVQRDRKLAEQVAEAAG